MSNLDISGSSIFRNDVTFQKNVTMVSPLTIMNTSNFLSGIKFSNIPEYTSNLAATENGIPLWGLYRTGGIIKIRLDEILPLLTILPFNGNNDVIINQYVPYIEAGATAIDNLDGNLVPYITSIYSIDIGELLTSPIAVVSKNYLLNEVPCNIPRTYTIVYTATDSSGSYVNKIRTVIIRDLVRTMFYNNTNITQFAYIGGRKGTWGVGIINGIKNSWYITSTALTTLDFKFNVPWKIILKTRITSYSAPTIEFFIDPLSDSLGNTIGRYSIQFGNELGGEFGRFTDSNNINNIFSVDNTLFAKMKVGAYIEIIYDLQYIKIRFLELSGNLIYSWTTPTAINYINNYTPFSIYTDVDSINFYNGILYDISPTKISTFLDFNSRFNIV